MDAVEDFEREYRKEKEEIRQQEKEKKIFRQELPERFIARKLFGQSDKKYNEEYWARLERNWRKQKEGQCNKERQIDRNNKRER